MKFQKHLPVNGYLKNLKFLFCFWRKYKLNLYNRRKENNMRANELRIGNCILLDGDEIIITGIKGNTVWWKDGFDMTGMTGSKIEGILLTEEWLEKFGFYKHNNAWILKDIGNNPTVFHFSIYDDLSYNTAELQPPLEYVHQLQNLYFALTGEEL